MLIKLCEQINYPPPYKHEFGEPEMRAWYKEKNFLNCVREEIISERSGLKETVEYIRKMSELG